MMPLGTNYEHNSEWIYCKKYWFSMLDLTQQTLLWNAGACEIAWASLCGQAWMFTWTPDPGKLFPWRQRRTLLGQRWNIPSPSRILICLQMKNIIFVSNSGKHAGDLIPALNSSFINLKRFWRHLNWFYSMITEFVTSTLLIPHAVARSWGSVTAPMLQVGLKWSVERHTHF